MPQSYTVSCGHSRVKINLDKLDYSFCRINRTTVPIGLDSVDCARICAGQTFKPSTAHDFSARPFGSDVVGRDQAALPPARLFLQ